MSIATAPMTTEEMEALPENGMRRELIRGELREEPMTNRNRWHCSVETRVAQALANWLDDNLPHSGAMVVSGEAGFRLQRNPDTSVGIDVAYVSAEVVAASPRKASYFEGAPVLAVEILSPSDRMEDIDAKIELYREAGVSLIWIIHPIHKTVTVFGQSGEPRLFNATQVLDAEPILPGFRVKVAALFPL